MACRDCPCPARQQCTLLARPVCRAKGQAGAAHPARAPGRHGVEGCRHGAAGCGTRKLEIHQVDCGHMHRAAGHAPWGRRVAGCVGRAHVPRQAGLSLGGLGGRSPRGELALLDAPCGEERGGGVRASGCAEHPWWRRPRPSARRPTRRLVGRLPAGRGAQRRLLRRQTAAGGRVGHRWLIGWQPTGSTS